MYILYLLITSREEQMNISIYALHTIVIARFRLEGTKRLNFRHAFSSTVRMRGLFLQRLLWKARIKIYYFGWKQKELKSQMINVLWIEHSLQKAMLSEDSQYPWQKKPNQTETTSTANKMHLSRLLLSATHLVPLVFMTKPKGLDSQSNYTYL